MGRVRALSLLVGIACLAYLLVEPAAAASTFTVNSTADDPDASTRDGMCATDSGRCTLRAAIEQANTRGFGVDRIVFSIPTKAFPPPVPTIAPGSPLPLIKTPVVIDGTTQRARFVNLDGSSVGAYAGLVLDETTNSVIKGMVIGNFSAGIRVFYGGGHLIEGNRIGTNPSGNEVRPTPSEGIAILRSPNNVLRGNLVSGGSRYGIRIFGAEATNNVAAGNIVGLRADGTGGAGMGNGIGIFVEGGANTIGGLTPSDRNVVSVSGFANIALGPSVVGTTVLGNYVGTDATGTASVGPASGRGIHDGGTNNRIGGSLGTSIDACTGACNLVTTSGIGVSLDGAADPRVEGNFIGTNVTGNNDLPNGYGLLIVSSSGARIGDTNAAARNVISGNGIDGIAINRDSLDHRVLGNTIGLAADDSSPLGNGGHGVFVRGIDNAIGGGGEGAGNRIAFNGGDGVFVERSRDASFGNSVRENLIYGNGGLGIDLAPDGVNNNDRNDDDAGANERQNFPVLTSVDSARGEVTVRGTLDSLPDTKFRLEVFRQANCDASGNGEGRLLVGAGNITTDADGEATFTKVFEGGVRAGVAVTATVTGNRNTSEFSACRTAT